MTRITDLIRRMRDNLCTSDVADATFVFGGFRPDLLDAAINAVRTDLAARYRQEEAQ